MKFQDVETIRLFKQGLFFGTGLDDQEHAEVICQPEHSVAICECLEKLGIPFSEPEIYEDDGGNRTVFIDMPEVGKREWERLSFLDPFHTAQHLVG